MFRPLIPLCAVALLACGQGESEETIGVSQLALVTQNGTNLNGTNLNGTNLNGTDLSSILAEVSLQEASIGGAPLQKLSLEGSELQTDDLAGEDLEGAQLSGRLADGTQTLRIEDANRSDGIWRYVVSHLDSSGEWKPICVNGESAVAVPGRWDYQFGFPGGGAKIADPQAFTFGCRGAAVDKCINAGYQPWKTYGSYSGDSLHQACVRMIRADYCGDGRSQTSNRRRINIFDAAGIQRDTKFWLSEAEWDAHGARCVSALNRNLLGVLCSERLLDLGCGSRYRFSSGTLIISETPTGPLGIELF